MPLERWSDKVVVVRLADDPQLTEDLIALEYAGGHGVDHAVLDFGGVNFINSSNLAKLLRLRKQLMTHGGRIILCNIGTQVWGALLVTGLEKLFTCSDNVTTALATVQMEK